MSEFTGVHKANPFNSTDFTDCCGLAVIDETECPGCKKTVIKYKYISKPARKDADNDPA